MVAATVFHIKTATAPDDPAYAIVPSDWNSRHTVSAQLQPSDFANSNNVTFGVNGAGVVTASAAAGGGGAGVGISAGTTQATSGTVSFANSNGVTWGLNAQTLTASVKTDYQTSGAYLTTAALSGDTSKYAGINFAGTNITGTLNTSGLSLSVAPAPAATSLSFANSNGVSWGINASTITATVATNYQSQGPYLTTADLSQNSSNYAGINGASTGGSSTINTSGVSVNLPAYLTTAALSGDTSKYAGTGFTASTTAGTSMLGTLATNGLSLRYPAALIAVGLSAGTASNNVAGISFADSNGVSWGATSRTVTATVKTDYLTGALGTNTAQTNVTWTANSSGLSINAAGYAGTGTSATNASVTLNSNGLQISVGTAAAAPVNFSAGGASANLGSVVFSNSNNVSFGLNGSTITATATIATAGFAGTGFTSTTTAGTAIVGTHNTAGLSLGVPAFLTTADLSQNSSLYAGTGTSATNASITLNTAGLQISVGAPGGGVTISSYENMPYINSSTIKISNSTSYAVAFLLPDAGSFSFLRVPLQLNIVANNTIATTAATANASFQGGTTFNAVIYSVGTAASSRSLMSLASGSIGWGYTGSISVAVNGTQYSVSQSLNWGAEGTTSQSTTQYSASTSNYSVSTNPFSVIVPGSSVWNDIPFANSLAAGAYWLIYGLSTSTATNSAGFAGLSKAPGNYANNFFVSQAGLPMVVMGSTNQTSGGMYGMGAFSTAGGGTTANLPISALLSTASFPRFYFQLLRSA